MTVCCKTAAAAQKVTAEDAGFGGKIITGSAVDI